MITNMNIWYTKLVNYYYYFQNIELASIVTVIYDLQMKFIKKPRTIIYNYFVH